MENDFIYEKVKEFFDNEEEQELFLKTLQMKKEELNGERENASSDIETIIKEFFKIWDLKILN